MSIPKQPQHNYKQLRNTGLIAYAIKFLTTNYNINVCPDIIEQPYMIASLTKLIQSVVKNEQGKEYVFYTLEVSKRLLDYYTKDEILNVLYCNLIEFAYSYMGKELTPIQFQHELTRLKVTPISDLPIRGEVFRHICTNTDQHPGHEVIEYHYHTRMATDGSKAGLTVPCPICGGDFTIEKTIIDKPE